MTVAILVISFIAFTLSASAGLGGSLLLVPALILLLGAKTGIALAALFLAANNVAKVFFYRKTIPLRASAWVILMTTLGAWIGASALVAVSDKWIHFAVIGIISFTLVCEWRQWNPVRTAFSPLYAFISGATSGFSGTSGPLKGIALRNLQFSRQYLVGAASVVSLIGDATKSLVFFNASIFPPETFLLLVAVIPLMPLASYLGRKINQNIGERAYAGLFWIVMFGYTTRLLLK